jgi:class 3 adenylate cyclase
MGFGLHIGWAIEGAIGSEFKIDASYLSPNVNMASRLEAATKQFGVCFLLSGELRNLCTPKCQKYLRQIDCVVVKGASKPIELYTCDVEVKGLKTEREDPLKNKSKQERKMLIVRKRLERNRYKQQALNNQI